MSHIYERPPCASAGHKRAIKMERSTKGEHSTNVSPQDCIYYVSRVVGMSENHGGQIHSNFVGIICLPWGVGGVTIAHCPPPPVSDGPGIVRRRRHGYCS